MPEVKPTLHSKLAQIMFEAERIPKNGTAPQVMGGYKFVQVGDAADFIRKALAEKSISMLPSNIEVLDKTEHQTKAGGSMTTVDLRVTWTLTDGITGESATIVSYGAGGDSGDKYSGKATTSAMKYALLAGFLLSTGEDTELGADVRGKPTPPPAPDRPELERRADGLIGEAAFGSDPVDGELRQTPDGPAWGFALKGDGQRYQCLAVGPLAETLFTASKVSPFIGQRVQVWGVITMVTWEKVIKGKVEQMPSYPRIIIERLGTPDFVLPAQVGPTP